MPVAGASSVPRGPCVVFAGVLCDSHVLQCWYVVCVDITMVSTYRSASVRAESLKLGYRRLPTTEKEKKKKKKKKNTNNNNKKNNHNNNNKNNKTTTIFSTIDYVNNHI